MSVLKTCVSCLHRTGTFVTFNKVGYGTEAGCAGNKLPQLVGATVALGPDLSNTHLHVLFP